MFTFRKNGHFYEKIGKKGEPVCIDDEINFEVPDNWELCRLENLCSLLNPKIEEKSEYPYLNAKFLRNKIDPEIKEKGRFVEKNTKVILVDGENSGEVFLTHTDGYMGSTFRILYINSKMYDEYVLKLLELWKNPLKKSKKGAAIPHLNKDIFNKILVGIPPINEQRRMIKKINHIYPLIREYDLNKEKLDKLNSDFPDKLRSSILQEAIQGKLVPQNFNDEPASILLEKIREEKERLIKEKKIKKNKNESFIYKKNNHFYEKIGNDEPICIDDEIPFELPETWECVRLGTFNEIARGGSPRPIKQYITEDSNGINWIKIGDTIKGDKYIYSTKEKIKPEGMKKSRYVEEGDFLLTNSMSFGRPYILKTNGCIHDGWLVIKLNENLFYQDFMFYLLSSNFIFEQFSKLSAGSAVKNLKIDSVKKVLVPLPSFKEQIHIVKKIEEVLPLLYQIN